MTQPLDPEQARIRSYLQTQAAKLTHSELADKVLADMEQLRAAIAAVPAGRFEALPAEGEWSANDICAHLAHTSNDVARGILAAIDGGPTPRGVRDQMGPTQQSLSGDEWWQGIRAQREALLGRVREARGDEHLDVTWEHALFGPLNWREWVLFLRIHDLDHARQLAALPA